MPELVRFDLSELERLDRVLLGLADELVTELEPGFQPEHRYAGMAGIPFTLETVDMVLERVRI